WRLADRGPIDAFDEYTKRTIELSPGQSDAVSIEGLIIDFRYISADGELTRHSLLCWQCVRIDQRIYVVGYCPFREEMRTFRVDRMRTVIAFQNDREVPVREVAEFFSAFAADYAGGEADAKRKLFREG